MFRTKIITNKTKNMEEVKKLYNDSFPADERIPWNRLLGSFSEERIMKAGL